MNGLIDGLMAEVGRWPLDVGRWRSDVGRRTSDVGRGTSDVGRRTSDVGRRTHSGPLHLLFIAKMLQKYKKNDGIILKKYYLLISQLSGTSNISQLWTHQTPICFRFLFLGPPPQNRLVSPSVFEVCLTSCGIFVFSDNHFLKILKHK